MLAHKIFLLALPQQINMEYLVQKIFTRNNFIFHNAIECGLIQINSRLFYSKSALACEETMFYYSNMSDKSKRSIAFSELLCEQYELLNHKRVTSGQAVTRFRSRYRG